MGTLLFFCLFVLSSALVLHQVVHFAMRVTLDGHTKVDPVLTISSAGNLLLCVAPQHLFIQEASCRCSWTPCPATSLHSCSLPSHPHSHCPPAVFSPSDPPLLPRRTEVGIDALSPSVLNQQPVRFSV